jgi:hypothetical protein
MMCAGMNAALLPRPPKRDNPVIRKEKQMRKLVLLSLLFVVPLVAQEPRKGTICFGTDCSPTSGTTFDVKPADAERRFVWTAADGASFVLGTLAAKATSIDVAPKDASDVTFSLRGDARRGWPAETRIMVVEGKDRAWRWSVPAKLAGKPMTIRLPRGLYGLQFAADHHRTDRRQLRVSADVALRDVILPPLPAVNGRVVTTKKSDDGKEPKQVAVAGAQLLGSDGKVLGSTNEQGAFRVELPEPVTKEIVVLSSGHATRTVPLTGVSTDTDLGTIELGAGVKLTVRVDRAASLKSKTLQARLTEKSSTQYENTTIATRDLKPGETDLVFPDLSEGEYYLSLSGDSALERQTSVIHLKAEDVMTDVHLAPFEVAGSVRLGTDPLRGGVVEIQDRHHTWKAQATVDADGHFGGTMWQSEDLTAWVTSKDFGTLPSDDAVKLSGDPAPWDIVFKRRLIAGHVFDEETKQPVGHTDLSYQLEVREPPQAGKAAMSRLYSRANVADDGAYTIVAMRDGVYDLTVTSPDHIPMKTTVEMAEHDESKTADFPLSRGVEQVIEFVWPRGEPIAQAMLIEGVARDGYNPGWMGSTDAAGKVKLRVRPDESKTIFIIPRGGSFAPVHVAAPGADPKPMHVVVPPPVGSLAVSIVDGEKKPLLGPMLMRFNGEWVPYSVVARLRATRSGPGLTRIDLLPAGAYELWGVRKSGSALIPAPTFAPPAREPVRVGLSGGEQSVEIVVP